MTIFSHSSPTLKIGEIVFYYAEKAKKDKYHICVYPPKGGKPGVFIFISSDLFSVEDLELSNNDFPTLKPNRTGKSCVGFSLLFPATIDQLIGWKAETCGNISKYVAQEIITHVPKSVTTLKPQEQRLILAAMATIS